MITPTLASQVQTSGGFMITRCPSDSHAGLPAGVLAGDLHALLLLFIFFLHARSAWQDATLSLKGSRSALSLVVDQPMLPVEFQYEMLAKRTQELFRRILIVFQTGCLLVYNLLWTTCIRQARMTLVVSGFWSRSKPLSSRTGYYILARIAALFYLVPVPLAPLPLPLYQILQNGQLFLLGKSSVLAHLLQVLYQQTWSRDSRLCGQLSFATMEKRCAFVV